MMSRDLTDVISNCLIPMWTKGLPVLCGVNSQSRAPKSGGSAAFLESLPEPGSVGMKETKGPGDIAPERGDFSSAPESRPPLSMAQARELALLQIDSSISSEPGMAAAF